MLNLSRVSLILVLLAGTAAAQVRAGGFRSPGFGGRSSVFVRGHRPYYPGYGYYAVPYFWDDYEPYDYEYAPPEPPPAPQPVVQAVTEPVSDAVMLELHGNQWVRVTNFSQASDRGLSVLAEQATPAKPLPAAVLVFRDGHTEEANSYSIIGNSIYVKGDYWTTGAWTRTIKIADLNVPATLKENQQRGLKFELPSSPNEVMIRP
ncbi:MAG TPA: hypothetical protein VLW06_13145 [Terriglobales bacterium]|nr:hypothetical protein [Terriglobales bacterium]